MVLLDRDLHGGQPRRLCSNDFDLRIRLLDRAGDAADEPAATDGNDDGLEAGNLFEQLKSDGSLARHDGGIVEGMDEGHVLRGADAAGLFIGLVVVGSVKNDLGAEATGRGDLDQRRRERHHDEGANASRGRMIGDSLSMIAGAGGDDAQGSLLRSEQSDAVQCAALLERAGHLQVLELEEDLLAGECGERLRVRAGRVIDRAAQPLPRGRHVGEADAESAACCLFGRTQNVTPW